MVIVIFVAILLYLSLYDLKHYRIPDWTVGALIVLAVWRMIVAGFSLTYLYGALAGFGWLCLLHLWFPRGMGWGDVKLAGGIGLFLGFALTVLAILLAFLSGAAVGVLLIVFQKKSLKDAVPFGPFLAIGAAAALLFGEDILDWYLNLWW